MSVWAKIHVGHSEESHGSNGVTTARYSILTFIPKNFCEQFRRPCNVFFAFIIILNFIPMLNVFAKEMSMVPLLIVLMSTAVKDACEDIRRHRDDRSRNGGACCIVQLHTDNSIQDNAPVWKDIRVGDLIVVEADEAFPADLVVLATSEKNGTCRIETANVDGETTLKVRYVPMEGLQQELEGPVEAGKAIASRGFSVSRAAATREIDVVEATMGTPEGNIIPLTTDNIVLRGCQLRSTEWVLGLALYTGHDTKVMLNALEARAKRSRLDKMVDSEVVTLVFALILFVVMTTAANAHFSNLGKTEAAMWYYDEQQTDFVNTFQMFGMSVIIFQVIVPVSLFVSVELEKSFQAWHIEQDMQLYCPVRDIATKCVSFTLAEDLGQVTHILSDKTGTLTANHMTLHHVAVDGNRFPIDELLAAQRDLPPVIEALEVLALCNTVNPCHGNGKAKHIASFEGDSPDEVALVKGAAHGGVRLCERSGSSISIRREIVLEAASNAAALDIMDNSASALSGTKQRISDEDGNVLEVTTEHYNILAVLPFTSERRRMTMMLQKISQGKPSDEVLVLSKGADSSMMPLCCGSDAMRAAGLDVDYFSSQGLRTLVLARRVLSRQEFDEWMASYYQPAQKAPTKRAERMAEAAGFIETNMTVVGVTAIEDQLQEGVPEAIASFKMAGIKMWMITGDKTETAVSIGQTCGLLSLGMVLHYVCGQQNKQCSEAITEAVELTLNSRLSHALIIDGLALHMIMSNTKLCGMLQELAQRCDVAICCRAEPMQKAQLTRLVKNLPTSPLVLTIGDGANDVSMLKEAHIGIGIPGEEGRQAAMASDYAIGQFRFLQRLLLVHGHWCYDRMCKLTLYTFYKSIMLAMLLLCFMPECGWSGQYTIDSWNLIMYAAMYNAVPPMLVGWLDQRLSASELMSNPDRYQYGRCSMGYNRHEFSVEVVHAMWHGLVCSYVPYYCSTNEVTLWGLGVVQMAACCICSNTKILMVAEQWYMSFLVMTAFGFVGYFIITLLVFHNIDGLGESDKSWATSQFYGAIHNVLAESLFYLQLPLSVFIAMFPIYVTAGFRIVFGTEDLETILKFERSKKVCGVVPEGFDT